MTGVTGFIGSAITRHLALIGHSVVGLHSNSVTRINNQEIAEQIVDVASNKAISLFSNEIEPCDAIIHCAALLDKELFAAKMLSVNCNGIQNMLWLSNKWKCREFVFLSSLPVIGVPKYIPVTEEHPAYPCTAYHASKLFGEHLVDIASELGVLGVSLRVTAPVGPRMPKNRLLPVLVDRALRNNPIELSGTGSRIQNYVDVRDVAQAVSLCLEEQVSGVFNIAGKTCISNIELAEQCVTQCESNSKILFSGQPDPEEDFIWDVSIEKARDELGYNPQYSINDAIQTSIDDVRSEVEK